LAFVAVVLAARPLSAHHGSAVSYDISKQLTMKGVVTEMVWRNPHVFIMYNVKDDEGHVVEWGAETHPTAMLQRIGWNRETIKPGDEVTVTLFPSRAGASRGLLAKIMNAEGKVLLDDGDVRTERQRGAGQ
jgi:hypothetical protein